MLNHNDVADLVKFAPTIAELEKVKLDNPDTFSLHPYLSRMYRYKFEELTAALYSPEGAE